MNSSPFKYEGWLYGLAFLIALGLRVVQLGAAPLSDSEASLALQALQLAQGEAPLLGAQPAYVLFTSVLFGILNTTNFMARFIPALAGSALVFAPYFFRDRLKPRPALILAFLFAIDPGLVAFSRQAGGTMLALTFLLFAWGTWRTRRLILAGIFAGLALLAGPSLWAGLLALGLTWLFLRGWSQTERIEKTDPAPLSTFQYSTHAIRPALISLILTLVLGGTLFFLSPNGLSAWLSALPLYLQGWTAPAALSSGHVLLAAVAYETLGLFLAALSLIRGIRRKSPRLLRLGLWLAVALLLAIFYRQPGELVWAIVPLLALAAFELARAFHIVAEERVEVGVVVLALLILLVSTWFGISKIGLDPVAQLAPTVIPIFSARIPVSGLLNVILPLVILLVCITFVMFGWSMRTAWLGTTWAMVIFLGVYSLGSAWGTSGLRSQNGFELWNADPTLGQADLLHASVDEVSEFSVGHITSQPVTVMGVDSPALLWLLRNRAVETVSAIDPQVAPPIVITPVMNDLGLPSAYRGQDFTWRQRPLLGQVQGGDWIRWLVFRQLPKEDETLILWVRNDLFPDGRETVQ